MGFLSTFQKAGGRALLGQYWHNRLLPYAIGQLLLTGRNQTSLELLRLGTQLKVYQKLRRRYLPIVRRCNNDEGQGKSAAPAMWDDGAASGRALRRVVWVLWLQGLDEAPPIVQACHRSLCTHIRDREIILLTEENLTRYVELPSYIWEKYRQGKITRTHLSDLIRVDLLLRHGGTWVDATVLCTSADLPAYMLDSDFFVFQKLKPGADGNVLRTSTWWMTARARHPIMSAVRDVLWEYWRSEDRLVDYFLLHHALALTQEVMPEAWKQVTAFPNSAPHILLLMLFDLFDARQWTAVTSLTPVHKLAYKRSSEDMSRPSTYYQHVIGLAQPS